MPLVPPVIRMVLPVILMIAPRAKNKCAPLPLFFDHYKGYAYRWKEGTEKIDTYQEESVK
jgi:hypothetical protein